MADALPLVGEALARWVAVLCACEVRLVTTDAFELLHAAEREPPTWIFIDATMRQAFLAVRALAVRCPETRIVVLDESTDDARRRRAITCGASGYLTKCLSAVRFAAVLEQLQAGKKVFANQKSLQARRRVSFLAADPATTGMARMTPREADLVTHLAAGLSTADCARILGVGLSQIKSQRTRLLSKLGLNNDLELTRFAIRQGLLRPG